MLVSGTVSAAERTVTLKVGNMFCGGCKYIVSSTLSRITGVKRVVVSYSAKTATVTFDDARTNPRALIEATGMQGFPSRIAAHDGRS